MTLTELKPNQLALVEDVQIGRGGDGFKTRLEAMGIVPGKQVKVLRSAILGGPLHVRVGSTTEIAIRRHEADSVIIKLYDGE
ncbi:ferrous iron transport protein A [Gloeocapsa sp. PCC 73106]|uniref:FeoA family protein n=1 Tax=Gloeocapsa sp. PCC 73106 TaxID=102232 RepID=UPI0002ABA9A7|nr:ferrous iron transport protein A [Gloeocapsa sp. PCC 73106]ELR98629.1 Fe2+ transport system protein A [Gloeocapsa sp. PCC 73106]